MPGRHNALNALASVLAGAQAGIAFETAAAAIASFQGVDRRFQHKASVRGIDFYDDYGHHPTEVRAVLAGVKEKFPDRRLVTVFQPHRYSRTRLCWEEFRSCFAETDLLFLLDIYAAGEAPVEGINSTSLSAAIDHPACRYLSRASDPGLGEVKAALRPGDILLTLGAGDVSRLGEQLSERLAKG
jgi:UDP-N-acetylmuramate--alanine ligase